MQRWFLFMAFVDYQDQQLHNKAPAVLEPESSKQADYIQIPLSMLPSRNFSMTYLLRPAPLEVAKELQRTDGQTPPGACSDS